jgi:hypothetical protein
MFVQKCFIFQEEAVHVVIAELLEVACRRINGCSSIPNRIIQALYIFYNDENYS